MNKKENAENAKTTHLDLVAKRADILHRENGLDIQLKFKIVFGGLLGDGYSIIPEELAVVAIGLEAGGTIARVEDGRQRENEGTVVAAFVARRRQIHHIREGKDGGGGRRQIADLATEDIAARLRLLRQEGRLILFDRLFVRLFGGFFGLDFCLRHFVVDRRFELVHGAVGRERG